MIPVSVEPRATARIFIIGAGAVGCALAGHLARAGADVTLVARGTTLDAIQKSGLLVKIGDQAVERLAITATDTLPAAPGDCIILALKSQDLPALAAQLDGRQELVIPVVNGMPFWFGTNDATGNAVDPQGALARALPKSRLAGCAAYMMAQTIDSGQVHSAGKPLLRLGAVAPENKAEVSRLASLLEANGIRIDLVENPAEAAWEKLIANAATNPLSVITGATLRQMHQSAELRLCVEAVASEMTALGRAAGLDLPGQPEACLKAVAGAGDHLTSMRQDFDAGRALEFEAICAAPLALGDRLGIAMHATRSIFALTRHLADTRTATGGHHGR